MKREIRRNPCKEENFRYNRLHLQIQKFLREVLILKSKSALERGCGIGILRNELLRRAPEVHYFGCDFSCEAGLPPLDRSNPQESGSSKGAQVPAFAKEQQQVLMAAIVTADTGEALP